jgi:hypothetical protein
MIHREPIEKLPGIVPAALVLIMTLVIPAAAISLSPNDPTGRVPIIANGDSVYINGIATGQPSQGLQVWLIGTNYVKISTVSVNADSTYSYELKPADTRQLASGQYVVLIQHPMMNGRFDVYYNPSTGAVYNRLTGMTIFQLTGSGSLNSPDSAIALMQAINSQNIDDTFASTSFYISSPDASINPIGDHAVGDRFTIHGSTNLAAGDNLMVEIRSSEFGPTQKNKGSGFSGASGEVTVVPGTGGLNQWSFDVDTTGWKPDDYLVTVSGITVDVTGSATFRLVQSVRTPAQTPLQPPASVQTTILPATSVPTTVPATVPAPTKSPVFPAGVIAGLAVLVIARNAGRRATVPESPS